MSSSISTAGSRRLLLTLQASSLYSNHHTMCNKATGEVDRMQDRLCLVSHPIVLALAAFGPQCDLEVLRCSRLAYW